MPTIQDRFVMRRGLAADLARVNEVPLQGEWVLAIDAPDQAHMLKIGDGSTDYNSLDFVELGGAGDDFAVASGTDTITATFGTAPTLTDGLQFKVRAAGANATTTPTFNPNSLGALTITKLGGVALAAGDISGAGHELIIRYRQSPARYELVNPAGVQSITAGAGTSVDLTNPRGPVISSTLGSIALSGYPATYSALPTGLGTGDAGKAYMVAADALVYIWNGSAFPASGSGISLSGSERVLAKWNFSTDGVQSSPLVADVTGLTSLRVIIDGVTSAASSYRGLQYSNDGGSTWKTSAYSYTNSAGTSSTSSLVCAALHGSSYASAITCFGEVKISTFASSRLDTNQTLAGLMFDFPLLSPPINRIRIHGFTGAGANSNLTGGSIVILGK